MKACIAIDLGTSGFRARALDTAEPGALSGAETLCHPLPGRNVIDHLLFASTYGLETARKVLLKSTNQLLQALEAEPEIVAVCGNPGEMSLFLGTEFRDLLYDTSALERKGIKVPDRSSRVVSASELGLRASCDVQVPPAIKAEVGADAVALIRKSGLLAGPDALATDFGTNAELALKAGSRIYVGSAASGPAIEGQHIRHGMLAAPGAIADVEYDWGWKIRVLDEGLQPQDGDTIDLATGRVTHPGTARASGITGTGVIALVSAGLSTGLIDPPYIRTPDRAIHLQDGIAFSEADLAEAGKAFAAIRAGQLALAARAGLSLEEVPTCHLAGAAGAYADPLKARDLGLVPQGATTIVQHGNTSLELAGNLASGRERLEALQSIADAAEHVSFSADLVFKEHFLKGLSYWGEGARYPVRPVRDPPAIVKVPEMPRPARVARIKPAYLVEAGGRSVRPAILHCPGRALHQQGPNLEIDLLRCNGASCMRCEQSAGIRFGRPID